MFHMEAFSSSVPTSGANTFQQVNYVTSNIVLPVSNLGAQISPQLPYLHSLFGVSANLVHLRTQTPKFLPLPYPTWDPNNRGTAIESPPRIHDLSDNPLPLGPTDEFDIFATQNAGAAQTPFVFVQFCDGPPSPIPQGRYFMAHATSATTLTANRFTPCVPILDFPLPGGTYAMVGARCFSATALAFRILPSMGPIWRPGGVAVQAYDQLEGPSQRVVPYTGYMNQGWGVWLSFYQNVFPQVEVYATAGDVAEEFWFDLIQTSTATV